MGSYTTPEGDEARRVLSSATSEDTRTAGEVSALEAEGRTDYGPDGAFYALKGVCIDAHAGPYKYTACPFDRASQDSTSLGTFSGWGTKADGSTDHGVMKFTGGASCWNGPARSLTVTFECGTEAAMRAVDEPEKCSYAARVSTPAACSALLAKELSLELSGGHEEL